MEVVVCGGSSDLVQWAPIQDLSVQTRKPRPPPIPPKPVSATSEIPGPRLPRSSPTVATGNAITAAKFSHDRQQSKPSQASQSPHPSSIRIFTSHCGSFSVEAKLLDWKNGKVRLHKANGLKIAVPLSKFSGADVEYVLREMMGRVEARKGAEERGDLSNEIDETRQMCGTQAGYMDELERAYSIAT